MRAALRSAYLGIYGEEIPKSTRSEGGPAGARLTLRARAGADTLAGPQARPARRGPGRPMTVAFACGLALCAALVAVKAGGASAHKAATTTRACVEATASTTAYPPSAAEASGPEAQATRAK
jgi:hypothetical protein